MSTFPVYNPFNGDLIEEVPDQGATDTLNAIARAEAAFPRWKAQTAGQRSKILKRWYDLVLEHREPLAQLLSLEQGKPLKEARSEVNYGASFIEWFAEEAKRSYGDVIPAHASDKRITVLKEPVGIVAAITPWNFPVAMITRKIAPALAAGCPVIIKPAEDTPLCALELLRLAHQAGFPPGVVQVLTSRRPAEVGKTLMEAFSVRKLSFTGSTAVGKLLMKQSAETLKKVSLELGGNAPFLVFEDADLDAAIKGAMASKYRNAGQTCICTNRFLVHESLVENFSQKLALATSQLVVGNGLDAATDVGPLINAEGFNKVNELLEQSVRAGAKIITGGHPSPAGELCFTPTVLTDVSPEMNIYHEEIFGPIATIIPFRDEEEAIRMANDTKAGLAAYFYGADYRRIWRVAEALEYGMVGINTGLISAAVAPFGGIKESGFGREGSKYGMDDYLVTKYMCWGI